MNSHEYVHHKDHPVAYGTALIAREIGMALQGSAKQPS